MTEPHPKPQPRFVALMRHSVRQGTRSVDDPLNSVAGESGAHAAAQVLIGDVLQQLPSDLQRRPFMVVSSPFVRCTDTAMHVARSMRDAGYDVQHFRIANCMAEESSNILRYFKHRSDAPATVTELLPMAAVLDRTVQRNRLAAELGPSYARNSDGFRDHALATADTNRHGFCARLLQCVRWCMELYPHHNLLFVGHLHLVASCLRSWSEDGSHFDLGFAAFAAWVDGASSRWVWRGIPHKGAKGRVVQLDSLPPVQQVR